MNNHKSLYPSRYKRHVPMAKQLPKAPAPLWHNHAQPQCDYSERIGLCGSRHRSAHRAAFDASQGAEWVAEVLREQRADHAPRKQIRPTSDSELSECRVM